MIMIRLNIKRPQSKIGKHALVHTCIRICKFKPASDKKALTCSIFCRGLKLLLRGRGRVGALQQLTAREVVGDVGQVLLTQGHGGDDICTENG